MNRSIILLTAILSVAACGGGSGSLPEATGKGAVRAINTIPTSPEYGFFIEERALGGVSFKQSSALQPWDDLDYTFNFEVLLPPNVMSRRVASQFIDVVRDVEYSLVISGAVDAPTITVWENPIRDFDDTATVFEVRVGHAAEALGPVDVYFNPDGVAPVLGEELGTLAAGEVSVAADYTEGEFSLIVTAEDDPSTILFQSNASPVLPRQSILVTLLDGDANDLAPVAVRLFNSFGGTSQLVDNRFLPTVRFVHATMDLETSDIYDDEMLMNQVVADLAFGDSTGDIEFAVGESPLTFTAAGNPGAILFETVLTAITGTRLTFYMTVANDELIGTRVITDRRSIETFAKLSFFHSASNHTFVDVYLVDPGETIDDKLPRQFGVPYGFQSQILPFNEGSFDLYITISNEKTILDGPISIDAVNGDVFEGVLLDRVDPNLVEFKLLPAP